MDEEVIAREHAHSERTVGVAAPRLELAAVHLLVVEAAEGGDRTSQRLAGSVHVGLVHREIGAQGRLDEAPQLGVVEHLGGRAVEPAQLVPERRAGQRVKRRIGIGQVRSAVGGDEQVEEGRSGAVAAQRPRQLEGHKRPHAVAEERERPVEMLVQRAGERLDQGGEPVIGALRQALLPPRQLDRAELDPGREEACPGAERRRPASGMRQAEESDPRLRPRLREQDPGGQASPFGFISSMRRRRLSGRMSVQTSRT